jgi:NAD-dependent dihydropyrimidine dehydrogenase PreA subunit
MQESTRLSTDRSTTAEPRAQPRRLTRREVSCHLCGSCKWSRGRERVIAVAPAPDSPVDVVAGPDDGSFEWVCQVCGSVARREAVLLLDGVQPA